MDRRQCLSLVTGVTASLVGGCVGRDLDEVRAMSETETSTETETGSDTPTATPTEKTVTITADGFDPSVVEVAVGSVVEWVNESGGEFHVKSYIYSDDAEDWEFSEVLGADETTSATFDEEGIYQYYSVRDGTFATCGMVKVGGATTDWNGNCL